MGTANVASWPQYFNYLNGGITEVQEKTTEGYVYNDGGNDLNLRAWIIGWLTQLWFKEFQPLIPSVNTTLTGQTGNTVYSTPSGMQRVNIICTAYPLSCVFTPGPPERGLFGQICFIDATGAYRPLQPVSFPSSSFQAPDANVIGFVFWPATGVTYDWTAFNQYGYDFDLHTGFTGAPWNPVLDEVPFP